MRVAATGRRVRVVLHHAAARRAETEQWSGAMDRRDLMIIDDAVVSHEGPFVHLEPHAVPDLLPVDARVQLSPENLPCCGCDFGGYNPGPRHLSSSFE